MRTNYVSDVAGALLMVLASIIWDFEVKFLILGWLIFAFFKAISYKFKD